MDVYCRSNISALNKWKKDTSVCTHTHTHTQPLIHTYLHTSMNTRIHPNTQKCSAITVNMHNLINIFARLQWLSSPSSGLWIPTNPQFPSLFSNLCLFLTASYYNSFFLPSSLQSKAVLLLPKGTKCINTTPYKPRRLQYDSVGLYVHEVQPCTRDDGAKTSPVMCCCFFLKSVFFLHSCPAKRHI